MARRNFQSMSVDLDTLAPRNVTQSVPFGHDGGLLPWTPQVARESVVVISGPSGGEGSEQAGGPTESPAVVSRAHGDPQTRTRGVRNSRSRLGELLSKLWRYKTPDDLEPDEREWLTTAMQTHLAADASLADDGLLTVEARVLGPMKWMNHYAAQSRWRHSALRLIGVLAGSITPALAGLELRWPTVIAGVVAASSLAVDQSLGFGDRWRHHRAISEALKREAWLFIERRQSERSRPLEVDFAEFIRRVEDLLRDHWASYLVLAADRRESTRDGATDRPV
jgi:hypothetical protein